jgi:hypothetical protein
MKMRKTPVPIAIAMRHAPKHQDTGAARFAPESDPCSGQPVCQDAERKVPPGRAEKADPRIRLDTGGHFPTGGETMKISATTVMLPEYDLVQTCELLQRLGFDGVEWRVRRLAPGQENAAPSAWGRHLTDLSPENILSRAAEVKRVCADHGLGIAGFASACSATDLEQVRLLAEGAQACGCPPSG